MIMVVAFANYALAHKPYRRLLTLHSEEACGEAPLPALREGRLAVKDRKRLLEALDLRLALTLTLLVRLRLRNAPLLDLPIVLHDGAQLRVCRVAVRRELADSLVQTHELLRLVLYILSFDCLCHCVLLCGFLPLLDL